MRPVFHVMPIPTKKRSSQDEVDVSTQQNSFPIPDKCTAEELQASSKGKEMK